MRHTLPTEPALFSVDQLLRDEEIMQLRTEAKAYKLKAECRKYRLREESLKQTSGLEAELTAIKSRMREERGQNAGGAADAGIRMDDLPALNVGGDGN